MAVWSSIDIESERNLVSACASGSSKAREEFVQHYGRLIIKVVASTCSRLSAYRCEVDDLVGHVYEKLLEDDCRRLQAWRGTSKLSTYVATIARNLVIDHLKRTRNIPKAYFVEREPTLPSGLELDEAEEDQGRRKARLEALGTALNALPCQQLAIMRLRLEGNSLRDIAAMMSVPAGTVFVLNSRALRTLKLTIISMTETQSRQQTEELWCQDTSSRV